MVDLNKLSLWTEHPIDKIVGQGSISIVNDGSTSNAPQSSKIVSQSVTNPYGKKVLVRFKWSVDNVNFHSAESILSYAYTITITSLGISTVLGGLMGAVSGGVSDNSIIFRTANGYHSNVTRANPTAPDVYTPISQTFYIEYVIFEVE